MTIFDKVYLSQRIVDSKTEEIKRLRDLALQIPGADPSKEFISGGPRVQCKFEEIMSRVMDLETELYQEITEYLDMEVEARKIINSLEDPTMKAFMQYRYLDRLTYEQIAEAMGYSVRQIYNIKKKTLHFISLNFAL